MALIGLAVLMSLGLHRLASVRVEVRGMSCRLTPAHFYSVVVS